MRSGLGGLGTAQLLSLLPALTPGCPAPHREDWDPLAPVCVVQKYQVRARQPCTLPTVFRCPASPTAALGLPLLSPPPAPETPPAPGSPQRGPTLNLSCKRKSLRGRSRKGNRQRWGQGTKRPELGQGGNLNRSDGRGREAQGCGQSVSSFERIKRTKCILPQFFLLTVSTGIEPQLGQADPCWYLQFPAIADLSD